MKDVFEWPSKQIAETLDMSPAAVNSALQRRFAEGKRNTGS
ncbi:sigma factor-like helix-turn-helix DNA-binding protein [Paenibacillus caseinilyticus]|nr:sigma factor-like helix-turn-helix DNA-binding protein [Paenibacillus mucilaginosus]